MTPRDVPYRPPAGPIPLPTGAHWFLNPRDPFRCGLQSSALFAAPSLRATRRPDPPGDDAVESCSPLRRREKTPPCGAPPVRRGQRHGSPPPRRRFCFWVYCHFLRSSCSRLHQMTGSQSTCSIRIFNLTLSPGGRRRGANIVFLTDDNVIPLDDRFYSGNVCRRDVKMLCVSK